MGDDYKKESGKQTVLSLKMLDLKNPIFAFSLVDRIIPHESEVVKKKNLIIAKTQRRKSNIVNIQYFASLCLSVWNRLYDFLDSIN